MPVVPSCLRAFVPPCLPRPALALLLAALLTTPALGQADRKVREHPGWVDGSKFVDLADEDGRLIEVTLGRKMLGLFSRRADRRQEDSIAGILKDLIALSAVIADVGERREEAEDMVRRVGRDLETERGWEQFVHVREPGDQEYRAFMHMTDDDRIDGLVVVGFTDERQLLFVNLVGIIDMERIAMLGERMGLPGLDDLPPRSEVEQERREKSVVDM